MPQSQIANGGGELRKELVVACLQLCQDVGRHNIEICRFSVSIVIDAVSK